MSEDDHFLTASWGSRKTSISFREQQAELVAEGHYDVALQLGIDDIKTQFPGIYDRHINDALASAPRNLHGSIDWSKFKRKS